MTAQYPRCSKCCHLECLHDYHGSYKACTMCDCEVKVKQDVVFEDDEKNSAKYWAELER